MFGEEFYNLRLGLVVGDGDSFRELGADRKGVSYTLICRGNISMRDIGEQILACRRVLLCYLVGHFGQVLSCCLVGHLG